jgi:uncharacterized metal-binding protein
VKFHAARCLPTKSVAAGVLSISQVTGTLELCDISMAIRGPQGLIIVDGCSHAAVEKILEAATKIDPHIRVLFGASILWEHLILTFRGSPPRCATNGSQITSRLVTALSRSVAAELTSKAGYQQPLLWLHKERFRFPLTHVLSKNSISSWFRCLRRNSRYSVHS